MVPVNFTSVSDCTINTKTQKNVFIYISGCPFTVLVPSHSVCDFADEQENNNFYMYVYE